MAPIHAARTEQAAQTVQTLPRLLASSKDFTELPDQVRQAARIIGLPDDWSTVTEEGKHSEVAQRLVPARAEWVLHWVLHKLKEEGQTGAQARAFPQSWVLLGWMVHISTLSKAVAHLQDVDILSILEQTLQENFGLDETTQVPPNSENVHMKDASESSETVQEDPRPSRKRKRPSADTSTPTKRVALQPDGLEQLFVAIAQAVGSIYHKSDFQGITEGLTFVEQTTPVLRAESAQAARLLKLWLMAVSKLVVTRPNTTTLLVVLDLSTISNIWDLRKADPADKTQASSAEQFCTECLVPILALQDELLNEVDAIGLDPKVAPTLRKALRCVEGLIINHLLSPSRISFYSEAMKTSGDAKISRTAPQAEQLASNLEALRAKLLSAAQIQDAGGRIPKPLLRLYDSIPRLLEMIFQNSRSRTPQEKTLGRSWIQSAFRALVECAGCSFELPEFPFTKPSIKALERSLNILILHSIKIDSSVLADVFWFHSGVNVPSGKTRRVQWPVIAALAQLDADLFLIHSRPSDTSTGRPSDLAEFLFDQISSMSEADLTASVDDDVTHSTSPYPHGELSGRSPGNFVVLKSVVVPIMSAFARNRDLLGFVRRWDSQLCRNAPIYRSPVQQSKSTIWQDTALASEFSNLFEQSLTQTQILSLVRHHIKRVQNFRLQQDQRGSDGDPHTYDSAIKVFASVNLLQVMLAALSRDETISNLEHELQALLPSCASLFQDSWYRTHTDLSSVCMMLTSVVAVLWPLQLHTSAESQTELLLPLIDQVSHAASSLGKSQDAKSVDSKFRASAFLFLCTCCSCLRAVPGWEELIFRLVREALQILKSHRLDQNDQSQMVEIFCSDFVHLLEHLDSETRDASLLRLLTLISQSQITAGEVAEKMSEYIFTSGSIALREAYSLALTKAFGKSKNEYLRRTAQLAASQIRPRAMSREQREALLNKLMDLIQSRPEDAAIFLSVMNTLMEMPNATAKISSDGGALFEIMQTLHDRDCEHHSVIRLLHELVQRTLGHIFPNQEQAQNKQYLESFGRHLVVHSTSEHCFPTAVAMFSAVFLAQRDFATLSPERYLEFLGRCTGSGVAPSVQLLEAYNEVPDDILTKHAEMFNDMQSSLREWLESDQDVKQFFERGDLASAPLFDKTDCAGLLFAVIEKYRLQASPRWLLKSAITIVQTSKSTKNNKRHLDTMATSLQRAAITLPVAEILGLVAFVSEFEDREAAYPFLHPLILSLPDKLPDDDEQKSQLLSVVPKLCRLLANSGNSTTAFTALTTSIDVILRDKPVITSQQSFDNVLAALEKLCSPRSAPLASAHAQAIYARLCETAHTTLLLLRGRLGGRFHLLLPLLQNMLLCLFIPNPGRGTSLPPWLKNSGGRLSPTNAAQYAKLLSTLCSPTQSSVSKHRLPNSSFSSSSSTKASLNDPVKAAREYASHYMYPLLASFCQYQLFGRLEPDVRDKLMPGIWEVVGTASLDKESLEAMFAGTSRGVRDVWRGTWEEWGRVGGGRGGRW
ncbi:hypothetical protein K491DRAFT_713106 [Lophiostoma macrostomum CBS 122681]|uniref:Nucleolar 27S pre-rRNA processing Urb2/Npa2 C-terminal domain-containing protein n=1 Tax=Lophiostoma macrostomum CBS 122681 TaxID=1314788 RepID=A0A6A6TIS7_9PLEO|nr:hypothetical protein K491DRAFT_713106 [Lophiostoma macrostomum CBS 122681]